MDLLFILLIRSCSNVLMHYFMHCCNCTKNLFSPFLFKNILYYHYMNKNLLCSCILSSILILFIIINNYNDEFDFVYLLYLFGIITSILNHGTCYTFCKYLDRFAMILIFFYLFNIIQDRVLLVCILGIAALSYFYSKISKQIKFHYLTHSLSVVVFYFLHY